MFFRGGLIGAAGVGAASANPATFVQYAADAAQATSLSIALPAGTQNNDVMFAMLVTRAANATITAPADWALVAGQYIGGVTAWGYRLYQKTAASESGPYTWSFSESIRCTACITTWRGANPTAPVAAFSDTQYSTNDTICRAASITTTAPNQTVVKFCFASLTSPPTFTPPADFTERVDFSAGQRASVQASSRVYASAGATGALDSTMSANMDSKHAILLAVASA